MDIGDEDLELEEDIEIEEDLSESNSKKMGSLKMGSKN